MSNVSWACSDAVVSPPTSTTLNVSPRKTPVPLLASRSSESSTSPPLPPLLTVWMRRPRRSATCSSLTLEVVHLMSRS